MDTVRLLVLYMLLSGCFTFSPAFASPIIPLPIERLAGEADLVLQGRVNGITVQRDEAGRIYTQVALDVAETWKGEADADIFTIVHSGGVLGNELSATDGEVSFSVGDEVVVFVVVNSRGEGVTVGMNQGKFDVMRPNGLANAYVRNLFHGGAPPQPGGKRGYRLPFQLPLTLQALKHRVTKFRP